MKKSVYERKYHLQSIINVTSSSTDSRYQAMILTKIDLVFKEMSKLLPQKNGNRKRMISIIFILKQLFKILNLPHKNIPITKSKRY